MTEQQRQAVIEEARTWLRTPYHHEAGVKGAGVDCAFLLIRVFHACGLIPDIDPRPYPADWALHRDDERYLGWVDRYARRVDVPQPGDIAIWKFGRCFSHAAIVTGWPEIIHAYRREGCVQGDGIAGDLAGREVRFYSVWGA